MIFAIDIGNSRTVIGVFNDDELIFKASIETARSKTEYEYAATFYSILSIHGISKNDVNGAIISSVVPTLNSVIKKAIKLSFDVECLVVGPGVKTGLKIKCDDPATVGADLICASVGAASRYPRPCLIIDMDTATKLIYIDHEGAFAGVIIAPGMNISLNALISETSQLPEVSLEAPEKIVGKNTADSIRSGIIYGNAAMIDGLIEKVQKESGVVSSLIATGELFHCVEPYLTNSFTPDEDLLLRGLNIIYKKSLHTKNIKSTK